MEVNVLANFDILREEWNVLLSKSSMNTVFMTWEWLSTWWKHFGEGRKLLILTLNDKKKILALAPLMLSKYKVPILGTIRKVEFIGAPDSDYHGFMVLDGQADALKYFFSFLNDSFTEWDCVQLKEIPESFPDLQALRNIPSEEKNLQLKEKACSLCPYIEIPSSVDDLMKKLSGNMRANLGKRLRRLQKIHDIQFARLDQLESVNEAMKAFVTLHQKRWESKHNSGIFGGERGKKIADFHVDIAEIFLKKGWLGLYFMTADNVPISAQYTFEYEGKMYFYLPGLDPEYYPYSVGNLITKFVLEDCIKRGIKEYDMLRGNEPYKESWATGRRQNLEIRYDRKGAFRGWLNKMREAVLTYREWQQK